MWILLACAGEEPEPVGDDTPNEAGPTVQIVSPVEGTHYDEGVMLTFEATGDATGAALYTWGVDSDAIGTGRTIAWEAIAGDHVVTVQLQDDVGTVQDSVSITVDPVAGDDTGSPPPPSQTVFDVAAGVPDATWGGFSVGPDRTLWAAGSAGLVHLDGEAGTARVYTSADGLLTDEPESVLAHGDGTLWVGHAGDDARQGEQMSVDDDGELAPVRAIDFAETDEIAHVLRLREQPFGQGAGEVWMGTNEGLCVFDPSLGTFFEHAHPDHPHGDTRGVAFTDDASIWNGDDYHLTRWTYAQDGVLSPSSGSGNLVEILYVWPVAPEEEPIGIADLHAAADAVWVASTLFGVARVDVAEAGTPSASQAFADPWPSTANAIRVAADGAVWVGADDGLYRWDGVSLSHWAGVDWLPDDAVHQLAVDGLVVWVGTPKGIVRVVGVPE
ncbi:MAG: hypothetical protein ACOZNI_05385 [Myxococcota bacterium]